MGWLRWRRAEQLTMDLGDFSLLTIFCTIRPNNPRASSMMATQWKGDQPVQQRWRSQKSMIGVDGFEGKGGGGDREQQHTRKDTSEDWSVAVTTKEKMGRHKYPRWQR